MGSLASTVSVSTHLDIAPQHHLFMKGRNGSNIKHITQRTGAQIHFPEPSSPQKKSTVYIQGTIESVCLARQYLMVGEPSAAFEASQAAGPDCRVCRGRNNIADIFKSWKNDVVVSEEENAGSLLFLPLKCSAIMWRPDCLILRSPLVGLIVGTEMLCGHSHN